MKNRSLSCAALLAVASVSAEAACDFEVLVNDSMQFQIKEMVADSSCDTITVTLQHEGQLTKKVMGHNWTLSKTEDLQGIAMDGMNAGLENDYIKPGDERVIAHTKIIGGGESDTISFSPSPLTPGGDYSFFCSYPGHWSVMRGTFVLK
ncbi:MAG: azurin [Gammaproteobacteria bacterium]|jgi:azurin|nr:azurin [Gammaproteobacteria bacterium]